MLSAMQEAEQPHANALMDTLEIPTLHVDLNVQSIQNVLQTKPVRTKNVLIHALACVEPMQIVKSSTIMQPADVSQVTGAILSYPVRSLHPQHKLWYLIHVIPIHVVIILKLQEP